MRYFIITIDTEGDNLWHYNSGEKVMTENSRYIPRFQELCEKYGFKPVWLTNYEMVCDQRYVDYIKPKMEAGLCEVGIHVHAWNNPPIYKLEDKYGGNPYLIEYPYEIMREKFKVTYDLLTSKFGRKPISHRAGRWAMNEEYFNLLAEFNIKVDCSYTPTKSWVDSPGSTLSGGTDYSKANKHPHYIGDVLEMPTSLTRSRVQAAKTSLTIKDILKSLIKGKYIWLRPACTSLDDMNWLTQKIHKSNTSDYLMFMMHSSEMMPGGSPYFPDNDAIERMYDVVEKYFKYVVSLGYKGVSMSDYIELHK